MGYLNHHIRNSLTVIEMAEGHVAEAAERLKMVSNASTRIRRCIEKISREEDCDQRTIAARTVTSIGPPLNRAWTADEPLTHRTPPATCDDRMLNEAHGAVHDTLLITQLEVVLCITGGQ